MGTDDVAILWARDRANHRSAFARAGRAPADRVVVLGTRCRVRGNTNMVNPIGTSHRHGPLNGDGPPKQTGLVTNDNISSAAAAGHGSIVESRLNTTAIRTPDASAATFFSVDAASVRAVLRRYWQMIKMRVSRTATLGSLEFADKKASPRVMSLWSSAF